MKGPLQLFPAKLCCLFGCVLYCLGLVPQAKAQIITMTDNNSVAQINTGSQAGMFNWSVDGVNQLAQQWFWYRIGNTGPEASINTISAPVNSTPTARQLTTTYIHNLFSLRLDYGLNGGAPGSGVSDMNEQIRISNTSGTALDFHFFQYSDFDLAGTTGGDTVQLARNLSGLFYDAIQSKGPAVLSETVTTLGANHGEANFFNATLVKLNDGVATTLNDNAGPVGPGDVTWAFEWDLLIAPGGSVVIGKDKGLQVPEPSTWALIASGLLACVFLQRRRQTN